MEYSEHFLNCMNLIERDLMKAIEKDPKKEDEMILAFLDGCLLAWMVSEAEQERAKVEFSTMLQFPLLWIEGILHTTIKNISAA